MLLSTGCNLGPSSYNYHHYYFSDAERLNPILCVIKSDDITPQVLEWRRTCQLDMD